QMLALSRAFLGNPRVLLLDEISMGLAPRIVEQLFESVAELRERGLTIVLVEQYLTYALRLADICYVLAKGRVEFVGEPGELRDTRASASRADSWVRRFGFSALRSRPNSAITRRTAGLISSAGALPAECTRTRPSA